MCGRARAQRLQTRCHMGLYPSGVRRQQLPGAVVQEQKGRQASRQRVAPAGWRKSSALNVTAGTELPAAEPIVLLSPQQGSVLAPESDQFSSATNRQGIPSPDVSVSLLMAGFTARGYSP